MPTITSAYQGVGYNNFSGNFMYVLNDWSQYNEAILDHFPIITEVRSKSEIARLLFTRKRLGRESFLCNLKKPYKITKLYINKEMLGNHLKHSELFTTEYLQTPFSKKCSSKTVCDICLLWWLSLKKACITIYIL